MLLSFLVNKKKIQEMVRISMKKELEIDPLNFALSGSVIRVENNKKINYNLELENDYVYLLEEDVTVNKYYEQRLKLVFAQNNEIIEYTPSFYVEYDNGYKHLIDIQFKNELEINRAKFTRVYSLLNEFCLKNKFHFVSLTDCDIRNDYLSNIKFLTYYKNPLLKVNRDYTSVLVNIVKKKGPIEIEQLIKEASNIEETQAELIYLFWMLVSFNLVKVDKSRKLTMSSLVWLDSRN